jgi:hypothetical protein
MRENSISSVHKEPPVSIRESLIVSAVLFIAVFLRVPSITEPIGPDQGIMAVIGEGLLHGKLPYRDYFEMASPAIFFTYALMFKVFGPRMSAIPLTDIIVSVVTTLMIFVFCRAVWGRTVGYWGSLFFAVFSSGVRLGLHGGGDIAFGTFWYIAQRETFMLPLIIGSFYFVLSPHGQKKPWRLVMAGLLSGLAFVYKFPAALFSLCIVLYMNLDTIAHIKRREFRRVIAENIWFALGFVASIIPFIAFFASKGALNDMTDIIFKYVYAVYGQLDRSNIGVLKVGLFHTVFVAWESFIIWIFFITSTIFILLNDRTRENLLAVAWGAASILYLISHKEFFGYHYLVILPPFSVLAGYGIVKTLGEKSGFADAAGRFAGKAFISGALAVNLIVFAAIVHMHYTKFFFYATGRITKAEYYNFFTAYPEHDYSFRADYNVAQYILEHTDKNDLIYTLGGIESAIYFLTKRESPSRFIYSWILFSYDHSKVSAAEALRRELLTDLKAKPPKYIVTVRSLEEFRKYGAIYDFIKENYILDKVFEDDRFLYLYNCPA